MSRFKPQVTYMTDRSLHEYWNASPYARPKPTKYIVKEYNTYRELKKDLPEICETNIDPDGVHVVRSRRGQWGEWNETWKLGSDGKPYIDSETWS